MDYQDRKRDIAISEKKTLNVSHILLLEMAELIFMTLSE